MTRTTVRFAINLMVALGVGLALQVWIVALLGRQGTNALYLRALYTPLGYLALAIAQGLTVVVQLRAGMAHRNARHTQAIAIMKTCSRLGVSIFAGMAVMVLLLGGRVTAAFGVDPAQRGEAVGFLALMCAANGISVLAVLNAALLRGTGQVTASAGLTVGHAAGCAAATYALQTWAHTGVDSIPYGYLAFSATSFVAGRALIRRMLHRGDSRAVLLRSLVGDLTGTALPVAASFLLLSLVASAYLWLLRGQSPVEITGFSLGQIMQSYAVVPAAAIGSAAAVAATITPGPDRLEIRRLGRRALLLTTAAVYVPLAIVITAGRSPLVAALTGDRQIRQTAAHYLGVVGPTVALLGITVALLTFLEQVGHARSAFVLNVIFFAAVVAVAVAIRPLHASTLTALIAMGNVVGCAGVLLNSGRLLRRSP